MIKGEIIIGNIFTPDVTAIESNKTVLDAARLMKEKGVRELIVVSKNDVSGILVDRDLTKRVVALNKDPAKLKVSQVMSRRLITATESDLVETVVRTMIKNDISRIPVVRGDALLGLVTYREILKTWPAYVALLEEEAGIRDSEENAQDDSSPFLEGYCSSCGNFSEDLMNINGTFLCRDCREK